MSRFRLPPAAPRSRRLAGRAARRPVSAVVLAIAILVPAAGPVAAARPSVPIPTAIAGRQIIVTYDDSRSLRSGGHSRATRAAARLDTIATAVYTPTAGREAEAVADLAAEPGVVAVEIDTEVHDTVVPNDRYWKSYERWAHDQLNLPAAWGVTRGASGTIIAVIDSGLQVSHPEFAARVVSPYDFVENDRVTNDPRGHGTMSSGAAAARGNNTIGVAGACWTCRIMPVRVLNGSGSGYASNVIKGINWAANHGADVITMSFGGFTASTAMQRAITYARSKGAVVLASAGNEGNTKAFYPAAYSGVIAVAANQPSGAVYSWSNRGSWVELTAPGCFWTTKTGSTYGNFCGTSASTPLVAGLVGLLRSARPTAGRATIESALLSTATRVSYVRYGRPNAAAALRALGLKVTTPAPTPTPTPTPTPKPTPTSTPTPTPWPTPPPSNPFVEAGGVVVVEAEHAATRITRRSQSWTDGSSATGFAGTGYVAATPDKGTRIEPNEVWNAPELRYRVRFSTPGTYRIWTRLWAPDGAGNSLTVGLDGAVAAGAVSIENAFRSWAWTNTTMSGSVATLTVTTPGEHTINIWMREDGIRLDRLVLTTGLEAPTGVGPVESGRV